MPLRCRENTALDFDAEITYLNNLEKKSVKPNLLFVYGILKRGYERDLIKHDGKFISEAHIPDAALYGIGRNWDHESHPNDGREWHGVGLRLNVGPRWVAHGELFEIPDRLWLWLDQIENNGHMYERKVVPVVAGADMTQNFVDAWVYEHMYKFENVELMQKNIIEGGVF